MVYSTFFGGTGADRGLGIGLVRADNVIITGLSASSGLTTLNTVQVTFGGGTCTSTPCTDAFVTSLDLAHNTLVYATYLGGNNADEGHGIAVDSVGAAYVTGFTSSTNFPTLGAWSGQLNGSYSDAFVVKIAP